MVNNILFCYQGEKHTENESERKQHFLQQKRKHSNSKEAHMGGSKSTGRKYAMLLYSQRSPEEASIHTAEMSAIKEKT